MVLGGIFPPVVVELYRVEFTDDGEGRWGCFCSGKVKLKAGAVLKGEEALCCVYA